METGSFITRDPSGFEARPNLYTYVSQNPWSKFDPMGLDEVNASDNKVYYVEEYFSVYDVEKTQIGSIYKGKSLNKATRVSLSDDMSSKLGVPWLRYGALQRRDSADNYKEYVGEMQNYVTGDLVSNDDVSTQALKSFAKSLEATKKAFDQKLLRGKYSNKNELMEGFTTIGERGFISGMVTQSGRDTHDKQGEIIIKSLETSHYFDELPGTTDHPIPAKEGYDYGKSKAYATDWGKAESSRLGHAKELVDNAIKIRDDDEKKNK